ncbi:MAG: hypothetical protein COU69_01415 [Candidatus Pacebacteria bacterium CG10_big_fil_rev_8_21_14_0_10_56_10]|nr:MAG: hypothetical protein COU69_01415 [Candidatus Pacebacteria bacterium CG10_big_fil_rev_8_21_14_0_10_56_10]
MTTFIIAALTADGSIAKDSHQPSTRWTSAEDGQFFARQTKQSGVMVMGRTTFTTIGRTLPGRTTIVYTSRPAQFSHRFSQAQAFGPAQPNLVPGGLLTTKLGPRRLITALAAKGLDSLAICGGTSIYTQFLEAGVVDKLYLTIEPVVFGDGLRLFGQLGRQYSLRLDELRRLSAQTVVLEYSVEK